MLEKDPEAWALVISGLIAFFAGIAGILCGFEKDMVFGVAILLWVGICAVILIFLYAKADLNTF